MKEFNDISELLESDKHAMAFYNSLPMSTQRKLHRDGVKNLKELYGCTSHKPVLPVEIASMNTASAAESTGSVPAGGDMTLDEWQNAKDISQ